jgi:hypothetical protein
MGMILLIPISAAFSRNHSNRLEFLISEMAIVMERAGAGYGMKEMG